MTACAPLEDEDQPNAHLTQKRITYIQSHKKDLMKGPPIEQRHVTEMASERAAANWLISLPLKRYSFSLTKFEFRERICIRYNIEAKKRPLIVHVVKSSPYHMLSTVLRVFRYT